MTTPRKTRDPKTLRPATQLVHGGSMRFELRGDFRGSVPDPRLSLRHDGTGRGAIQGRCAGLYLFAFANPTVAMFERRMALLEAPRRRARPPAAWRRSPPP